MLADEERHRLVAWLTAEFEVQNGIDVSNDTSAIARLQQAAELAAAASEKYEVNLPFFATDETGPKHFHVVLDKKRIDDIRAGREGPPHVDRARRSVPPEPKETRASDPPKPQSSSMWLVLALIVALAGAALAFALGQSHHHDDHDGHGQEHKR